MDEMIFVMAMAQSGVLGEGFHSVTFPAAIERERLLNDQTLAYSAIASQQTEVAYQPYTVTRKLNAERTATTPRGFGTKRMSEIAAGDILSANTDFLGSCGLASPRLLHDRSSSARGQQHSRTRGSEDKSLGRGGRRLTMSMNSCTSPTPSVLIFPISRDTRAPSSSRCGRT